MKNKKKLLVCIMSTIIAFGCTSCNAENSSNISVTINGNAVTFDQPPVMVNDRTLVPLRTIFEALGATVDWNGDTQTVTSTRNNTTVSLTIGSDVMTKNDTTVALDVPAQLIGERTLVPVRAIAEAFGSSVDWNGETQTVIINDNAEQNSQLPPVEATHTYTTQYGTVNAVNSPQFAFDYSDNWTVTTNDVIKGYQEGFLENLVLTNSRGVTVNYINFGKIGGSGKSIIQYEVSKAADSQFTAGYMELGDGRVLDLAAEWGNFIVGEIKSVGEYDMKTGELMPINGGVTYAVIPQSYVGTHEATGLTGYYEEFVTEYGNYLLYAQAPDGKFTEEEKQEVIQILSTFRRISENL